MSRYAEGTDVSVRRSKEQIEALLQQHGAEGFHTGWDADRDIIEFVFHNVQIRFVLSRANPDDFKHDRQGRIRRKDVQERQINQYDRQRWRALYLVVRAKLEAVESGLAIFEQEFLGFIVTPDNRTLGEILVPRLQQGQQLLLEG